MQYLIAVGFSLAATASLAADSRNVSVANQTGYAIQFLGFNAPDDGMDEWDNELEKVLQNQTSTYIAFDDDDEVCVWNIRVDWQNYDESVLWKNANVCKFNVLRLRYDPQDHILHGRVICHRCPDEGSPRTSGTLPGCVAEHDEFVLCKRNRLCYTQPRANDWFAFSSVAQR